MSLGLRQGSQITQMKSRHLKSSRERNLHQWISFISRIDTRRREVKSPREQRQEERGGEWMNVRLFRGWSFSSRPNRVTECRVYTCASPRTRRVRRKREENKVFYLLEGELKAQLSAIVSVDLIRVILNVHLFAREFHVPLKCHRYSRKNRRKYLRVLTHTRVHAFCVLCVCVDLLV